MARECLRAWRQRCYYSADKRRMQLQVGARGACGGGWLALVSSKERPTDKRCGNALECVRLATLAVPVALAQRATATSS